MFKDYIAGKVYTAGISPINNIPIVLLVTKNEPAGITCIRVNENIKTNNPIFIPVEQQDKPQYQLKPASEKHYKDKIELAERYLNKTLKSAKIEKAREEHAMEKKKAAKAAKPAKEKKVTVSGQIREMLEGKLCTKEEIIKKLNLTPKKATDLIWVQKMRAVENKTWIEKDGKFGIKA